MARPQTITNEHLLQAARTVFFEKGWQASTAQIAKEAGVSEGTLFKRFATKEDLFWESLRVEPPEFSDRAHQAMRAAELGEGLRVVGNELLEYFEVHLLPRLALFWSHPSFQPKMCFQGMSTPPPVVIIQRLSALFALALGPQAREEARILVAARVFMASLHQYAFFSMMGLNSRFGMERGEYLDAVIELLQSGLQAPSVPSVPPIADCAELSAAHEPAVPREGGDHDV